MSKLLIFLKHFLAVVLPLAVAGAAFYADSPSVRHFTDTHPQMAAYVPIVAGILKGVHGILPPSPYSIQIVKRATSDIDTASSAIIAGPVPPSEIRPQENIAAAEPLKEPPAPVAPDPAFESPPPIPSALPSA